MWDRIGELEYVGQNRGQNRREGIGGTEWKN